MTNNHKTTLDPHRIKPFQRQPRKRFRGIKQLAASIEAVGQCTPVTVSPLAKPEPDYDAQLTDGERRLKACQLLNRKIRVTWEPCNGEAKGSRFARSVAANFCRQSHDAMEIAEAIRQLRNEGRSAQEIARIFGKHITWVYQHAMLLDLAPEVQKMLCRAAEDETKRQTRRPGRLTSGLAILLAPLSHAQQAKVAGDIAKKKLTFTAAREHILRSRERVGKPQQVRAGRNTAAKPNGHAGLGGQFWDATNVYRQVVDCLAELEYSKLAAVMESLAPARARVLAKLLEELRDDLCGITRALKKQGEQ
jgi:ParB/RepB/Spo0J family partition protein